MEPKAFDTWASSFPVHIKNVDREKWPLITRWDYINFLRITCNQEIKFTKLHVTVPSITPEEKEVPKDAVSSQP